MGGYLSAVYLIRFPQNVESVFYADPWGFGIFNEADYEEKREKRLQNYPIWKRNFIKGALILGQKTKPLAFFRIYLFNYD